MNLSNLVNEVLEFNGRVGYISEHRVISDKQIITVQFQNEGCRESGDLYISKEYSSDTEEFKKIIKSIKLNSIIIKISCEEIIKKNLDNLNSSLREIRAESCTQSLASYWNSNEAGKIIMKANKDRVAITGISRITAQLEDIKNDYIIDTKTAA